MIIKDRHGNPIKLGNLYADSNKITNQKYAPFPIKYTSGLCKVTELNEDLQHLHLQVTYEITGSSFGHTGRGVSILGERLIPLDEKEVEELINDRKRRLSFLESSAQSQPKYTEEPRRKKRKPGEPLYEIVEKPQKNSKWPIPGAPFEQ